MCPAEWRGQGECGEHWEEGSSKLGLVGTYDKMKTRDGKRVAEEDLLAGHRMRMN